MTTTTTIIHGYYDYETTGQSFRRLGDGSDRASNLGPSRRPAGRSASSSSIWEHGRGALSPSWKSFFPNGVQAIIGTAYSSPGVTAAGAQVGVYSSGAQLGLGTASSGANGYFYEIVPAGTLPSMTGVKLGETITLAGDTAVSGLHYVDDLALGGTAGESDDRGDRRSSPASISEQTDDTLDTTLVTDLVSTFGSAMVFHQPQHHARRHDAGPAGLWRLHRR